MVRVTVDDFGTCVNPMTGRKEPIERVTIVNKTGITVQIITYGATITSLKVPDARGKFDDITLGFDDIEGYQTKTNPYIGCTVGRVCNRISNARYTYQDVEYQLAKNFGGRHFIHGGIIGFDKMIWTLDRVLADGIAMKLTSPHKHEGFPGEVTVTIIFRLTDQNCFSWCIDATTTRPTPVNMTNHADYNLAGHAAGKKALYAHNVLIKANKFCEINIDTMPTGHIECLDCHPLDCRKLTNIGKGLEPFLPKGYDHQYLVDHKPDQVVFQARVVHPPSGRVMEISSNKPCIHFYTAHNMPDVERGECPTIFGKGGARYGKHGSFCMETSDYTDAVNHMNFPSIILHPGNRYHHICVFHFRTIKTCSDEKK